MQLSDHRLKELKVTIPTDLHLQLLRRKILYGETITESVEAALRAYFLAMEARAHREAEPGHA